LNATTGSDLGRYGSLDQILAGFHQDLNFITLHGKSRFAGLHIWLRDGTKLQVSIPDGCLLAQAGMEFEYLTGGAVIAGYHEVVVTEKTLAGIARAKQNSTSLWRISSTFFSHIAYDETLHSRLPHDHQVPDNMLVEGGKKEYPPILAGDFVANELKVISLGRPD